MPPLNEWGQPVGPALPPDWRCPPAPPRNHMSGRFCHVEPLDPARHGPALFKANAQAKDSRHWTYLPYGPFESFESYASWLQVFCMSDDPLFFAIVDSKTHAALGLASYLRIAPASAAIEVGHLNFSPRLQQQPAATEAMYLMMKNAFDLGYRRYEWKCDALNLPSRAAAERLGLSFEGIFRQATVYKGRSRDTAWYAAIDGEWPVRRDAFTAWLDPSNFDESGAQRKRLSELTLPIRTRR